MDDGERDEILWRLDERTEGIQNDIEEVKAETVAQREQITRNRDMATQNRTILNTITFGLGTIVTTFMGKLTGVLKF